MAGRRASLGRVIVQEDSMLAVSSYKPDYVQQSHAIIGAQLAAFRALPAGKAREAFAPLYFSALVLALDSLFLHRQRSNEGKVGGPLNEVRMLCDSIKEHGAVMAKNSTIKYDASKSATGIAVGQAIALDDATF